MPEMFFDILYVLIYLYGGQTAWRNLELHDALSGNSGGVWSEVKAGDPGALTIKAGFLIAWPAIMFCSWLWCMATSRRQ